MIEDGLGRLAAQYAGARFKWLACTEDAKRLGIAFAATELLTPAHRRRLKKRVALFTSG